MTMNDEIQKIKLALDEHLSGINDNTTEIQALFDYLHELEAKVDKLNSRLDCVQLGLGGLSNTAFSKPFVSPLDQIEKKIFLVLYTEETPLSYAEIALKANVPKAIIAECISSLGSKGIPLARSFYSDQIFLKLDPRFKEVQAKENVVNLSLQSFME